MSGLRLQPAPRPPRPARPALADQLGALLSKDIQFGGRGKPSAKQREAFYLELGMLLGAGVDIKSALDLQVQQHRPPCAPRGKTCAAPWWAAARWPTPWPRRATFRPTSTTA